MIEILCRNKIVWRCDGCNRKVSEYTVLGGWYNLKMHYVVECGCPQADQDNTRYYCTECWLKSKDELIKRHHLKDSNVRLVRIFNTKK